MQILWWFITIGLFAVGLIGTVAPFLPGTTIIFAAAFIHRIVLGPEKSIGWITIAILALLTIISYVFDFLGASFGAKHFGATKWGTLGAIFGAVVGLFFGIIGLFVGPVIGAITGEFIAGKRMIDAGRAGWGSLVGNIGGMIAKLIIALAMIMIFLANVPSPF
jgi:uncharacterized protein